MPLLCELGWHRADPLARWNAGYYFTTCGRCGTDLVRTAYGGWRVPRGFKIVWQAQPPATMTAAELVPEEEAPVVAQTHTDQMELPIQEVLRQLEADDQESGYVASATVVEGELIAAEADDFAVADEQTVETTEAPLTEPISTPQEEPELEPHLEPEPGYDPDPDFDFEADSGPEPEPAQPQPVRSAQSTVVDDFMDDDWFIKEEPGFGGWDEAAEVAVAADADIEDDETDRVGNRSGKVRFGDEVGRVEGAPSAFRDMLRGFEHDDAEAAPAEAIARDQEAETRSYRRSVAATVVASFGLITLLIAMGGGFNSGQSEAATRAAPAATAQPEQAAQPAPPPRRNAAQRTAAMQAGVSQPRETGFVTASLLNCREAPAEQAEPVRILPRGETVQVLALEPAWASISHRGRQCWASTRYLSAQEPL